MPGGGGGGASESMTKDEYFKLCPTSVQEQVYAWVIASSFVCSWKPPRYGGRHILETELVYRQMISYKTSFVNAWYVRMTNPLIRTWLLLLNVIRIVISPTLTNAHLRDGHTIATTSRRPLTTTIFGVVAGGCRRSANVCR